MKILREGVENRRPVADFLSANMDQQYTMWLNRILVISVMLMYNLGTSETDPQDRSPTIPHARSSHQAFEMSATDPQFLKPYNLPALSYNTSNPQVTLDLSYLAETQFALRGENDATDIFLDTETSTPAVPPLLEIESCPTPMSLMLHSSFRAPRMQELARQIERFNLVPITYRDVLEALQNGICPPRNAIIVSIDDLGTRWLRPEFRDMIKVFTDRGFVLVLGMVVQGPQDPAIWSYLRELDSQGVEIASHTIDHYNLPQIRLEAIQRQVVGSYDTICEHLGRCPITLILPFGNLDDEGTIMQAASDYTFVVGIQGGRTFSGAPPYYLGRSPPDENSQSKTLYFLEKGFWSESTSF